MMMTIMTVFMIRRHKVTMMMIKKMTMTTMTQMTKMSKMTMMTRMIVGIAGVGVGRQCK